ncbi:MAG: hypothetical protein WD068_01810 [Candidatus Babeliales bacterium]
MKKLLIPLVLVFLTQARNPFFWDEKIQSIESNVVIPRLEGISIEPNGMKLAIIHHGDKRFVVEIGERIGHWKIKAIQHDSAVVEALDGKTYTISLRLEDDYA